MAAGQRSLLGKPGWVTEQDAALGSCVSASTPLTAQHMQGKGLCFSMAGAAPGMGDSEVLLVLSFSGNPLLHLGWILVDPFQVRDMGSTVSPAALDGVPLPKPWPQRGLQRLSPSADGDSHEK